LYAFALDAKALRDLENQASAVSVKRPKISQLEG